MKTAVNCPDTARFRRSAEHSSFQRFSFQHFSFTQSPLFPRNPLFPTSGPATSSFNGLHLKSKFLAITVYYYNDGSAECWLDGDGNLAADKVMNYADGFFVQRVAGAATSLVITGEVKVDPTSGVLIAGFNYLNSVAPVGLNLDNSNLKNFVSAGTDPGSVDNVLLPTSTGGYITTYYYNDGSAEGWLDTEGNLAGSFPIVDGFLILNRGGVKPYAVTYPN